MINSFGKTFTATESSAMKAKAKVIKDCSAATNAIHCEDEDVSCGE